MFRTDHFQAFAVELVRSIEGVAEETFDIRSDARSVGDLTFELEDPNRELEMHRRHLSYSNETFIDVPWIGLLTDFLIAQDTKAHPVGFVGARLVLLARRNSRVQMNGGTRDYVGVFHGFQEFATFDDLIQLSLSIVEDGEMLFDRLDFPTNLVDGRLVQLISDGGNRLPLHQTHRQELK